MRGQGEGLEKHLLDPQERQGKLSCSWDGPVHLLTMQNAGHSVEDTGQLSKRKHPRSKLLNVCLISRTNTAGAASHFRSERSRQKGDTPAPLKINEPTSHQVIGNWQPTDTSVFVLAQRTTRRKMGGTISVREHCL